MNVKHIAKLSRLELSKAQEKKFVKELSSILDYIEKLKEVDTQNIEPAAQVIGLANVMRDDEVLDKRTKGSRRGILDNAPMGDGDYIKVKAVF